MGNASVHGIWKHWVHTEIREATAKRLQHSQRADTKHRNRVAPGQKAGVDAEYDLNEEQMVNGIALDNNSPLTSLLIMLSDLKAE